MYVGKGRVRTELEGDNGERIVEIIDPSLKKGLLLFPVRKTYMERPMPELQQAVEGSDDGNPCRNIANAQCTLQGQELVNSRNSDKWEIRSGNSVATQWNDAQYKFAVKRVINGKTVMEMKYISNDAISGRYTEKWQAESVSPSGTLMRAVQWYDPELNIAIRQEIAGGHVRELVNIEVAPQPDAMFTVPRGYTKEVLPQH